MFIDLQTAIYQKLSGTAALVESVKGIYDQTPQENEKLGGEKFPYVCIGDDHFSPWDTDTELGFEAAVTIHVWSRSGGRKQNKIIQCLIYAALHRQPLAISGYSALTPTFTGEDTFLDADGLTQHGVLVFQIFADKN